MASAVNNYDLLEQVIIRADYSDIVQLQNVLDELLRSQTFISRFSEHKVITEKISHNDGGRYKEYHRFIEKVGSGVLYLDLSDDYCLINARIGSDKYQLGHYGDLMSEVLGIILGTDPFTRLLRVGIRKVYSKDCTKEDNPDSIFKFFDQKLTNNDELFLEKNYTETILRPDDSFLINYNRNVKLIDSRSSKLCLRFSLDIDVYCDSERILKNINSYSSLFHLMERTSWEMLLRSLKKSYIKFIKQYGPVESSES